MTTTTILLGLAWKSAIVAGLTLALLRLARRRSAGERSMIAHMGLAALLALPAAAALLPQWAPLPADWSAALSAPAADTAARDHGVIEQTSGAATVPAAPEAAESAAAAFPAAADLAPFLSLVPLALLFAMMLLAVVRLFAMRGRADVLVDGSWLSALAEAQRRMGFKHGTALLVSDELRSPISWGVLRPTIVLSPHAVHAVDEAEAIIAHELAHVARLDWAKLLGARVACALFWFNPLVWMLARESHQLREEAADDAVLMADIDGPDYASLLVGAARHDNRSSLLAAHGVAPGKGSLKRRITRVLDASLRRGPASASWMLMSLTLLAAITAPLAAFSATGDRAAPSVTRAAMNGALATIHGAPAAVAATGTAEGTATARAQKPLSADELISMRAVGVTPDYMAEMRDHDRSISADDIIAAKATGVDPTYIRTMRGIFPGVAVDDLIGAAAMQIEPAFARDMRSHFPGVGIDDVIALKAMGVDGEYVTAMRKSGVRMKSADEAIRLRAVGSGHQARAATVTPGRVSATSNGRSATVSWGPGAVIEARSADGRVARVEIPEAPEPPEPTPPPAPLRD